MLFMQHSDHLRPVDLERCTGGHCSGRRQSKPNCSSNRFLSNEVAGGEKRDRSLFTAPCNDSESCAALPKVENGISWISLRKEGLIGR
jgi:hypothetical protein